MTARSWDSYMDTLLIVLEQMLPETILEFGSGKSTGIMAMFHSVKNIYTYEHDQEYFAKFNRQAFSNLEMFFIPNQDEYAYSFRKDIRYDLIFVDGVNRARCLKESQAYLSENGVVILHDAQREEYGDAVKIYKYAIWTDMDNTVLLTDSEAAYKKLYVYLTDLKNTIGVRS